jgi:hypothetical protein
VQLADCPATCFVDEVLRLEPMVPVCQRFTTRPTAVGEVELPVGVVVEGWVDRAGHVGLVPDFRPVAEFPATQTALWLPQLRLVTRA